MLDDLSAVLVVVLSPTVETFIKTLAPFKNLSQGNWSVTTLSRGSMGRRRLWLQQKSSSVAPLETEVCLKSLICVIYQKTYKNQMNKHWRCFLTLYKCSSWVVPCWLKDWKKKIFLFSLSNSDRQSLVSKPGRFHCPSITNPGWKRRTAVQ